MKTIQFRAEMAATNAMQRATGFGAQNAMLVQKETSPTDTTLVPTLASCSNMCQLQVPGGVVGGSLEDAVVGCGQKRPSSFLYPTSFDTPPAAAAAAGEEDQAGDVDQDGSDEYYCSGGHNNNNNAVESSKKRRLTFEQVRLLERNFELENKLEPERKMQLAKELGLQPRQVAVWFQNRRARWKTKQLERDYELLSSDYTRLKAEFEATVQEKERLKSEVQRLSGKNEPLFPPRSCVDAGVDQPSHLRGSRSPADQTTSNDHHHVQHLNSGLPSIKLERDRLQLLSDQQHLVEPDSRLLYSQIWRPSSPSCTAVDPTATTSAQKGDQTSQQEEEEEQSTSAADSDSSNSSEILNTDSPRTAVHRYEVLSSGIIAANPEQQLQKSTCNDVVICCPRPTLTPDGNFLQQQQQQQDHLPPGGDSCLRALVSCGDDDDLGAATPSPQVLHQQRPSTTSPSHVIKLEADGNSYQSDDHHSCNYFLSQLDEKAAMQPWWLDWS